MENQTISNKIIQDAQDSAKAIIERALNDAENARVECAKNCEQTLNETKLQAQEKGEKVIERAQTLARLDAKKLLLKAKQDLLLHAVQNAKDRLRAMAKSDYLAFVEKQLKKHADMGDRVSLCISAPLNEEDLTNLAIVKELSLTVEKSENFGGGIKLYGIKSDKDLSFNAVVDRYLSVNAQEISAIIFK